MSHFVNDHVFKQVFRFLHEFGVKADMAGPVIAAAPLGFHPLKKILLHLDAEFRLPFLDQRWHYLVKQRLVPLMDDLGALCGIAARAHGQRDALVVERYAGLGFAIDDGQQIAPPPKIVALALDELPGRFARLVA